MRSVTYVCVHDKPNKNSLLHVVVEIVLNRVCLIKFCGVLNMNAFLTRN